MPHDPKQKSALIRDYLDGALPLEKFAEAERILTSDPDARTVPDENDKVETFISRLQEALAMPPFPSEQNDQVNEAIQQAVSEQLQQSQPVASADTAAFQLSDASVVTQPQKDSDEENPLSFLSPPQAAGEIGRLNGYRVLRQLGEGGMGMVFEAEDMQLKRRVALKVMKPEIAAKKQQRERFVREAQTAALVEHDYICPIYQVGQENGVPFIAMPFLKGEPLDVRLKRKGLPLAEAVRVGREVAEGLAAAHDAGLIHRDIKPGNVWLVQKDDAGKSKGDKKATKEKITSFQRVRILDFGLARLATDELHLTRSGAILGTPAYMAPEQARGLPVDHRADLFSLGVMLYEMTTGRRPFSGADTMSILTSLAIDDPSAPNLINAGIPKDLSDLIVRLLAKSPDKRPADAHEVAESLTAMSARMYQPIVEAMPSSGEVPLATAADATNIDPWQSIDDSTSSTAPGAQSLASPAPLESLQKPRQSRSGRAWIALALTLLFVGGGGLAAYKLYFETKEGTLVVEVEGEADVRFKNGELNIYGADGKLKYTLKPGERNTKLPDGPYTVSVTGADGVKLETDKFTMTRDGATVRVQLDPATFAKRPPAKVNVSKDPDRKAAEFVLSHGGIVQVNDSKNNITALPNLPLDHFRLKFIYFPANSKATDADMAIFKECKNLIGLDLSQTQIGDEGVANFGHLKELTQVALGPQVSDAGVANFKDCPNLLRLGLASSAVTDKGMAHFKNCKNLIYLNLGHTTIGDVGLAHFKDCKNLDQLELSYTRVSDSGLSHFQSCNNLTYLGLTLNKQITDAGLAHFKNCANLTDVMIGGTQLTDAGLSYFKHCRDLARLHADETNVSDAGMSHFKDWENLATIGLSKTRVTDAGMTQFKGNTKISQVYLDDTQITDAGLANLKDCKEMFLLTLARTKIGDTGLANFKGCKQLSYVDLTGTNVTDAGLAVLKDSKSPARIALGKTKVTQAGIDDLKKAFPQCAIVWDGGVIEPGASPDRKAAEYVLSLGGVIRVNDVVHDIQTKAELPLEPFRLTLISLRGNQKVTNSDLAILRDCKDLTGIDVIGTQIGDDGLAQLKGRTKLTYLMLGTRTTDKGLAYFKDCPNLETLSLQHLPITDAGLANFKDCKKLIDLYISHAAVTDAGVSHFKDCKDLKALELGATKISNAGLAIFQNCRKLTYLGLAGCTVSDGGLQYFKDCANLTDVVISGTQVTDAGLAHLKQCKELGRLGLAGTKVSDGGMPQFKNWPNLLIVALADTRVTDTGLAQFAGNTKINQLYLDGTQVTDAGLANFKDCKEMFLLGLGQTKTGDAGLAHFKGCKNLSYVDLSDSNVTDAGLAVLKDSASLARVIIHRTKVTQAGIDDLKKAFPKCLIEWSAAAEPAASPDRKAAEYVLSIGGTVFLHGDERAFKTVAELPRGQFQLAAIVIKDDARVTNGGLAVFEGCEKLWNVTLDNAMVSDQGLAHFKNCKNLTHLELAGANVSDAGLALFKQCEKLQTLHLHRTKITDGGLAHFNNCKDLAQVGLESTQITDAGLGNFKNCKALTQLNLKQCKVTAAGINGLAKALPLCKIEWDGGVVEPAVSPDRKAAEYVLSIGGAVRLNDGERELKAIADLPQGAFRLTAVNLWENKKVTDAGLAVFKQCTDLIELRLGLTGVTDAGLANFRNSTGLRFLDVKFAPIGDAGLANFKDFKELQGAELLFTQVTDAGLVHLKNCGKLAHLSLNNKKITDAGLAQLKSCTSLVQLWLGETSITDVGLAYFKDCEKLWGCDLHSTGVTDAALEQLKSYKNLDNLNLRDTSVSDAGLAKLEDCKSLKTLALEKTKVTAAGVDKFRKAVPQCKIEWDGGVIEPKPSPDPKK